MDTNRPTDSTLTRLEGSMRSSRDAGYEQGYIECYERLHLTLARRSLLYLLAGLILGGVIGVFASATGVIGTLGKPEAPDPRTIGVGRGTRFKAAADFAERYTVSILAQTGTGFFGTGQASGSGFVFDNEGHIVTNHHVVAGGRRFNVIWNDRVYRGTYIGYHPQMDVAVLKINPPKIKPAEMLEDGDNVFLAEEVLAVGSPFGLRHTVTHGIVSYVGRRLERDTDIPYIQTDCAINRGNSGGPLVNLEGRVVGMNRLIISGTGESSGVGFAIPISIVREVAQRIIDNSKRDRAPAADAQVADEGEPVEKAFLGASIGIAQQRNGLVVREVVPASPAERAGLKQGDIIQTVSGKPMRSPDNLMAELMSHAPGEAIEMEVVRISGSGKTPENLTLKVTLGSRER